MEFSTSLAAWSVLLGWLSLLIYNVLVHPLKAFPGPLAAGASTWWKTYIEVFRQKSMTDVLVELHAQYGTYGSRLLPWILRYTFHDQLSAITNTVHVVA
jgi:hypothetical protein